MFAKTPSRTNRVPKGVTVFLSAAYGGLSLSTVDQQHQMTVKHRQHHGSLVPPSRHVEDQTARGVHTYAKRHVWPA